ncbi:MAG: hypothetical protein ACHP9Y_00260 [Gammaproteobacteria bacterium]
MWSAVKRFWVKEPPVRPAVKKVSVQQLQKEKEAEEQRLFEEAVERQRAYNFAPIPIQDREMQQKLAEEQAKLDEQLREEIRELHKAVDKYCKKVTEVHKRATEVHKEAKEVHKEAKVLRIRTDKRVAYYGKFFARMLRRHKEQVRFLEQGDIGNDVVQARRLPFSSNSPPPPENGSRPAAAPAA